MAENKLILIVDDYDHSALLLAQLVEMDTPHVARSAKNGKEAIIMATSERFDVVALDIDMPILGGKETASWMRQHFGERRPVLIGMSVLRSIEEVRESRLFDYLLAKPFVIADLLELIEKA